MKVADIKVIGHDSGDLVPVMPVADLGDAGQPLHKPLSFRVPGQVLGGREESPGKESVVSFGHGVQEGEWAVVDRVDTVACESAAKTARGRSDDEEFVEKGDGGHSRESFNGM